MKFFAVTIALLATLAVASPVAEPNDEQHGHLFKRICSNCKNGKFCCSDDGVYVCYSC